MSEQPHRQIVTVTSPDGTIISEEMFDHVLNKDEISALAVATYLGTADFDFTVDELLSGRFEFLTDGDADDFGSGEPF